MESRPNSPYSNYRRVLHMQSPGGEGGKGAVSSADGIVKLKICQQNLWLTTAESGDSLSPLATLMVIPDHGNAMPPRSGPSGSNSRVLGQPAEENSLRGQASLYPAATGEGSLFLVKEVPQLKGVNMGGMFIPEVWMNPGFYNGTMVNGKMVNQPLNEQGQPLGWGGSL